MKYRPEIDGLRAIAVLPVILFHAGIEVFSGGFVGVDVFFVISGYLITKILIEEIEDNTFSVVNFYERRARRILPALFFVMLCCLPFAWAWMLPSQMESFSRSIVAVILFVSNILFWREIDYFHPESEEKPLLHTWSLAIEEQYYLLFPLFLLFAWRYGRRNVFFLTVAFTVVSLCLTELGWRYKPTANFYLIPTRAWELFAGSICAFIVQKHGVRNNNFLAFVGISAIAYSTFYYDANTPFPSIFALVPVFGTALLVIYAGKSTFVAKILSVRVFVGIGLISYSAYLWHQPLFAFYRVYLQDKPNDGVLIMLALISVGLAALTWKFIEKPFRNKKKFSRGFIFTSSVVCMLFFVCFGLIGIYSNGFLNRYSPQDKRFLSVTLIDNSTYVIDRFEELKLKEWIDDNRKKIILIGDSYAQDLVNAIYEADLDKKYQIVTRHISKRCGNLFVEQKKLMESVSNDKDKFYCGGKGIYEDEWLRKKIAHADEVWLASSWLEWHLPFLQESIYNLNAINNGRLRIFGRKNFGDLKLRSYLNLSREEFREKKSFIPAEQLVVNKKMKQEVPVEIFIDIQELICDSSEEKCKIFDEEGFLKTFDGGHLTKYGAEYLGMKLIDKLD